MLSYRVAHGCTAGDLSHRLPGACTRTIGSVRLVEACSCVGGRLVGAQAQCGTGASKVPLHSCSASDAVPLHAPVVWRLLGSCQGLHAIALCTRMGASTDAGDTLQRQFCVVVMATLTPLVCMRDVRMGVLHNTRIKWPSAGA